MARLSRFSASPADISNSGSPAASGHASTQPTEGVNASSGRFELIIDIDHDDPNRADVHQLLTEHLADMFATSPPESVHALDPSALSDESVTFWTAREDGVLLGCGALKELDPHQGEMKSMRTTPGARGRGVAAQMLTRIVDVARRRHYEQLCLETGSEEFFAPARRLYSRNGFTLCGPFANYVLDPHSVFMSMALNVDE